MKKVVIVLAILILFPLVSSEIIFNQQPNAIYNLGDDLPVPITIKSPKDVTGVLWMDLICDGKQENFYKNGVNIQAGDEKKIEASLVLTEEVIGNLRGNCKIKIFLGGDFSLTNEFKISDSIVILTTFKNLEFSPEEIITVSGDASKENEENVNGLIELSIIESNSSKISQKGTVVKGTFSISLSLPKGMKAGSYLLKLNAYEQDINGLTTNEGFVDQNILIKQIPTSLEIVFRDSQVEPGTNLAVKAILHDQTGEKIQSLSFISVKNENNKILEQVEINTDEFHEFPVAYNELPSSWTIVAVSNKITNEAKIVILEKEAIKVGIVDKILTITNTGNIPYNKTALIKIGDKSVNINVYLKVGGSQEYTLTAPDGSYDINFTSGKESATVEKIGLTGKAIDVKKSSGSIGNIMVHPFIWVFVLIILLLGILILLKRNSKRSLFGNMTQNTTRKNENYESISPLVKGSLINSRNKAELSTSMKGEKQEVSLVALNIKNLGAVSTKDGSAIETLQKIVDMAEDKRASTYEDNNSIIFILSPAITKTHENEKAALEIAQAAKETLAHHNKMFKQKMDFGISLGYGSILGKYENHSFQFSSIDSTLSSAKKISSLAEGEVLLSEKMNDRLRASVKATKHSKSGMNVYSIKEMKNVEENAKFVKSFSEKFKKENKTE
jgi:hypothetical protein